MKDYKKIIEELTVEQVITLLKSLGSENYKKDNHNNIIFQSVCHNSNSYKLYYYPETHNFFCHRDGENFNIFSLTMKVKGYKQNEFLEAYRYVCLTLGIETEENIKSGIIFTNNSYIKDDWEFLNRYTYDDLPDITDEDIILPPTLLDYFPKLFWAGWERDNISVQSMEKFNIRYDILNEAIIIPHYNVEGKLIGLRNRNLNPTAFAKYCPTQIEMTTGKKIYNHSLLKHLYGLDKNKEVISSLGKVMLCESEKSVMQCETYYPNHNFTVACCGSVISNRQIELLIEQKVKTVILGFDFDYETADYSQEDFIRYKDKLLKKAKKLLPYFNIEAVIDVGEQRLCGYKDSPTDKGKEVLEALLDNKVKITEKVLLEELRSSN